MITRNAAVRHLMKREPRYVVDVIDQPLPARDKPPTMMNIEPTTIRGTV
jgi:hypothetical protein